jgi:hypothetical protein
MSIAASVSEASYSSSYKNPRYLYVNFAQSVSVDLIKSNHIARVTAPPFTEQCHDTTVPQSPQRSHLPVFQCWGIYAGYIGTSSIPEEEMGKCFVSSYNTTARARDKPYRPCNVSFHQNDKLSVQLRGLLNLRVLRPRVYHSSSIAQ